MAIVSLEAAWVDGAAIVEVKRMAQSANDRCKDDLIGEKEELVKVRRYPHGAQDNERK
jgi:hypothetical protein